MRSELKFERQVEPDYLYKRADHHAATMWKLDDELQEVNWTTELVESNNN